MVIHRGYIGWGLMSFYEITIRVFPIYRSSPVDHNMNDNIIRGKLYSRRPLSWWTLLDSPDGAM